MTKANDQPDWKGSTRGESAWKEARDLVATRNEEARKTGKVRRDTYEHERESVRQAAEARRHAQLLGRRRTP
jgi:hypothetical protein